ncbi:MAG TPA: molybdopterin cofactor-binding domain-containing protein, partial [Rhizomicrobium sp.]|nr:molybdopterin cofactor-binding domain-containing protein [Rhizomicrobium sp.]
MTRSTIGDSPRRREDARFITGGGAYLDDLRFDRLAHAVVLRAPHAHALIHAVNVDAARRAPGVLAVLTAVDAAADGLGPLRPYAEANVQTGEPFIFAVQPLLAGRKARFAGEPVALIVAETPAQALDAAELVGVDYEPLAAVTWGEAARAAGAPLVSDEVPGNVCIDWRTGDAAGADRAFAQAAHIVTLALDNHRIVTNPMEPRGCIGQFDPT